MRVDLLPSEVLLLPPLRHDLILQGFLQVLHPLLHQAGLGEDVFPLQLGEEAGGRGVHCLGRVGPQVADGLLPPLPDLPEVLSQLDRGHVPPTGLTGCGVLLIPYASGHDQLPALLRLPLRTHVEVGDALVVVALDREGAPPHEVGVVGQ